MRNAVWIVLVFVFACGNHTGDAPASVAGTWSFVMLESDCPMFRPSGFVVGQTGSSVAAQFVDRRGNLCSLEGTYAPDRFRGVFRVEEPEPNGRVITLDVEGYSRVFFGERQVDGWARVGSDSQGQCVGAIVEFCAKIGDGEPSNLPPTLVFLGAEAATVPAGSTVQIRYADDDPDSVASTSLFADIDGDLTTFGDQVLIAANRPDGDGAEQTVAWDTTGVPPGTYGIYAVTTDGDVTITTQRSGGVTITPSASTDAPTLAVSSPAGPLAFCPGGVVSIVYTDDDADDVATTTIYADPDGDLSTTDGQIVIASDRPEMDGAEQTVSWSTLGLPLGSYSIVARTEDGTHPPAVATAPGTIELIAPASETLARGDGGALADGAVDAAALPDGSFYVTGSFRDSTTLGAGDANETTLAGNGSFDLFLARYNADGTLAWARGGVLAAGSGSNHRASGRGVAALSGGSCVLLGLWGGTATFGEGEPNETTVTSQEDARNINRDDVFVARYDADGTLLWVETIHSGAQDTVGFGTIDVFPDDSFVIAGGMNGPTAVFAEGQANETTFDVDDARDAFVARYDADGTLDWVVRDQGDGAGSDSGSDVAAYADGSSVATIRTDSGGAIGIARHAIARYDASGNQVWRRVVGNETTLGGNMLAGLPDGSFLVTGHFGVFELNTITFGAGDPNETTFDTEGDNDVFVARYNADGTLGWVRRGGGPAFERASSIAALPDGSLVATGTFQQTATFSDGTVAMDLTSAGADDMYVVRYDADGQLACARGLGTEGAESLSFPEPFADGSVLLVGSFAGSLSVGQTTLDSAGETDVLIVRYGPVGAR